MDKYFMWIHYERLHNHNKAKHNKTVCIFLGIYCTTASGERHVISNHQQHNIFLRFDNKEYIKALFSISLFEETTGYRVIE